MSEQNVLVDPKARRKVDEAKWGKRMHALPCHGQNTGLVDLITAEKRLVLAS